MTFFQSIQFWLARQIADALLFIGGGIVMILCTIVVLWLLKIADKLNKTK